MVYLSANGEVIGQFETKELPEVLAGGRIPSEAFFWREGMPEWRPLRELVLPPSHRPPAATTPKIEPIRKFPAAVAQPAVVSKLKLDPSLAQRPGLRQSFAPRAEVAIAEKPATETALLSEPAPAPMETAPSKSPGRAFLPRHRSPVPAATPAPAVQAKPAPRPAPAQRRGRWLPLAALLLLLLLVGGGAAAWWFFFAEPPPLAGEVRLAGAEGEMVPASGAAVFLVSREELADRWRRQSEEIQSRAAEFDALLEEARNVHREKSLVLELAANVSDLADEYKMPDAAELRAEREAAQAAEAEALSEVERLTREKDSASGPAVFLGAPPEAVRQTITDETGTFSLPLSGPVDGLAVLVVAESTPDAAAPVQGWLAPIDPARDRSVPLRFSPDNALDAELIKQIANAER